MDETESSVPQSHGAVVDREPRCWKCKKKLAESVARPWEITCWRCKARNAREVEGTAAVR